MSTVKSSMRCKLFHPDFLDSEKQLEAVAEFATAVGRERLAAITSLPVGAVGVWFWEDHLG